MVSEELLQELKDIVLKEFGLDLNNSEVYEIATSLLGYFEILAKIEYGES